MSDSDTNPRPSSAKAGPSVRADQLRTALRHLLKDRGHTYQALARYLGVSLATVKRLMTTETLDLQRLLAVCEFLGITLSDLELAADRGEEDARTFSEDQELLLAADPRYLLFLYALYEGKSPDQIAAEHGLTQKSRDRYVRELEKLRLVRVSALGRVTPQYPTCPDWRYGGPLGRAHYQKMMTNWGRFFLERAEARIAGRHDEGGGVRAMLEHLPISPSAYGRLEQELATLVAEHRKIAETEARLRSEDQRDGWGRLVLQVCHTFLPAGVQPTLLDSVFGAITEL